MDYIIIGIVCVGAVTYLVWRFAGILKGKRDLGCSGCEKGCGKPEEQCDKDAK